MAEELAAVGHGEADASGELTACLRNLISLLALPSLCLGKSLQEVLDLTVEASSSLLEAELGYARLWEGSVESCGIAGEAVARVPAGLRGALEPHLHVPLAPPGTALDAPEGLGRLHLVATPIGFYADSGVLLLGARRESFPTREELVQVRAAASLAASAIENARAHDRALAAQREAEAASRAKDEFLAMLGHELRNPLAPIVTALHILDLREGEATRRERSVIARQVEHLRRLVDDLLDISRVTRGRVELKRERVELAEAVDRALELAAPLLESKRQHLRIDVARNELAVDGDPARLGQVIANLLTNAAKYTEPGGRVEISAEAVGGEVVLRVRDDGIGIGDDLLPTLFEPFTQDRQAIDRAQGGLGLGLAIVKSLVELHGGTVSVESGGRGQGSEFVVRLPRAEPSGSPADAADAEAAAEPASGLRILIVDDNRDASDSLAELLRLDGHEVEVAYDGREALAAAESFTPEVALLDIGLPGLDGHELARRLRRRPELRDLRTIAISGYGLEADRERSRSAGFAAHLVKPIDLPKLRALLAVG